MAATFDERAFVSLVEASDADDLAQLLVRPNAPEEQALRAHLGADRYQRLHGLALRRTMNQGPGQRRGNVVVIHDVLGSELTAFHRGGDREAVWPHALSVMAGGLARLRLSEDGRTDADRQYQVRPTGVMKRYYGDLLLCLSEGWNVRSFCYDWRKDLSLAAAELQTSLNYWFDEDAPIHIVAHGMGGLVARTFIKDYPKRWQAMLGPKGPNGSPGPKRSHATGDPWQGGRLIMLGTPNHGSFTVPVLLAGADGLLDVLEVTDRRHTRAELLHLLRSFTGLYQMLPSPLVPMGTARRAEVEALYRADTYGELDVPQEHLNNAREHHDALSAVIDGERMCYVGGDNRPTITRIRDVSRLRPTGRHGALDGALEGSEVTLRGDGSVSHERGVLVSPTGGAIPAFSVDEGHGGLATNEQVLAALDELLAWGTAAELTALPSAAPAPADSPVAPEYVRQGAWQGRESVARVQGVVRRMATRDGVLSGGAERAAAQRYIYPEERAIEEGLTRTFLAAEGPTERSHVRRKYPIAPAKIEIGLEYGALDAVHLRHVASSTGDPIDALAVGHYVGVRPQGAARALDEAISQALPGKVKDTAGRLAAVDLILTQFAERGTLRGELGQPFFVGDPRPVTPGEAPPGARVIAVAGMGLPGRLGVPELTVLTRELCWALGRMGKRHLATVLIGTGRGNLPVGAAAEAWMRGVKHAVTGPTEDERRQIERITFVEHDPRRVEEIHEALVEACRTQDRDRMQIDYRRILDDAEIAQLHKDAEALELAELDELRQARQNRREHRARRAGPVGRELDDDGASAIATRVTIQLDEATSSYRFGAITETASIPERNIPLDPSLVMHANDELAAEWEPELQVERGRFMAGLLVPQDLQPQLSGDAPLVLLLDASAARIHWELLVQSTPSARPESDATDPFDSAEPLRERASEDDSYRSFLGTSRGLTRQLRTTFAPPPEPPPPSRRVLRLLVVADPAEDARLEGAEAEGVEIADLFESFNRVYRDVSDNRVEVVRLFGPREATRTNVLRHLMLRTFDAFHFAGHCIYEAKNPAASGFVFTGGTRISANELKRIDRVPKFVFANACQSGVTPGRSELRSVELAPSFAEAFFARGVSNFVCTAWPVGDWAAREFALTLYAGLLGLVKRAETPHRYQPGGLFAMHEAMREARLAVARTDRDARTWGAYQHYGSPHFRFFSPVTFLRRSNVGDQNVGDQIGGEKAAGHKTAGDKEVEIGAQR